MENLFISITNILINLFSKLEIILQGNEFAIGLITTGILGYLMYFSKIFPVIIWNFMKKHFTTSLEVSSEHEAYFSLVKQLQIYNINNKTRVIKLLNGMWGDSDTIKAIGYGSQLFLFKKNISKSFYC